MNTNTNLTANLASFDFAGSGCELFFVITTKPGSKIAGKTLEDRAKFEAKLKAKKGQVILVSQNTEGEGFVLDEEGFLKGYVNSLGREYGENLVVLQLNGGELKFVELKQAPNPNTNWMEALEQYAENYGDGEPDGAYYKWGQVVAETGEYYCKDCGFVLNLEAGQLFPICESCLSGEPDGISGPETGYWEKIS